MKNMLGVIIMLWKKMKFSQSLGEGLGIFLIGMVGAFTVWGIIFLVHYFD